MVLTVVVCPVIGGLPVQSQLCLFQWLCPWARCFTCLPAGGQRAGWCNAALSLWLLLQCSSLTPSICECLKFLQITDSVVFPLKSVMYSACVSVQTTLPKGGLYKFLPQIYFVLWMKRPDIKLFLSQLNSWKELDEGHVSVWTYLVGNEATDPFYYVLI